MYPEGTTVVNKRMSFPSVLVLSLTMAFATLLVCVSGIAIYGLRVVDKKADGLVGLVRDVAENLPAYREALPPALSDAINDVRSPDYLKNIEIKTKLVDTSDRNWQRAVVEVENKGDEVISFLSMRLVGTNENGSPIFEENTWAASPINIDDNDWRGPILPHHTRVFPIWIYRSKSASEITHEVTEIRTWVGPSVKPTATASAKTVKADLPTPATEQE